MDVEHNFGLSKITVVDRNFGPSKSTIVDHYFGHPKLRLWTVILDCSFFFGRTVAVGKLGDVLSGPTIKDAGRTQ